MMELQMDVPTSVPRFLEFINANGPTMSREWVYRQIKAGAIPCLRLGSKILVIPSAVLESMKNGTKDAK